MFERPSTAIGSMPFSPNRMGKAEPSDFKIEPTAALAAIATGMPSAPSVALKRIAACGR